MSYCNQIKGVVSWPHRGMVQHSICTRRKVTVMTTAETTVVQESDAERLARLGQEIGAIYASLNLPTQEQVQELADLTVKVRQAATLAAIQTSLGFLYPDSEETREVERIMREHKLQQVTMTITLNLDQEAEHPGDAEGHGKLKVHPVAALSIGKPVKASTGDGKRGTPVQVTHDSDGATSDHDSVLAAQAAYEPDNMGWSSFDSFAARMTKRGYTVSRIES